LIRYVGSAKPEFAAGLDIAPTGWFRLSVLGALRDLGGNFPTVQILLNTKAAKEAKKPRRSVLRYLCVLVFESGLFLPQISGDAEK
jgi:hypothetical protein